MAGNDDMALPGFNRKIITSRHIRRIDMFYTKLPSFRRNALQQASLRLEGKRSKVMYSITKKTTRQREDNTRVKKR